MCEKPGDDADFLDVTIKQKRNESENKNSEDKAFDFCKKFYVSLDQDKKTDFIDIIIKSFLSLSWN